MKTSFNSTVVRLYPLVSAQQRKRLYVSILQQSDYIDLGLKEFITTSEFQFYSSPIISNILQDIKDNINQVSILQQSDYIFVFFCRKTVLVPVSILQQSDYIML